METSIHTIAVVFRTLIFLCQPLLHRAKLIRNDQSAVIWMTVRMRKERNQATMFTVESHKAIEIHIKHSIRVQQKKVRVQLVLDFEKRTSIAERLLFKIILNMDTKGLSCHRGNSRAVSKVVHDDVSQMRNSQNNVGEPLVTQAFQLMFQNRLALNFYHWLGNVAGNRGNPCSLATGHYYCFHLRFFLSHIYRFNNSTNLSNIINIVFR